MLYRKQCVRLARPRWAGFLKLHPRSLPSLLPHRGNHCRAAHDHVKFNRCRTAHVDCVPATIRPAIRDAHDNSLAIEGWSTVTIVPKGNVRCAAVNPFGCVWSTRSAKLLGQLRFFAENHGCTNSNSTRAFELARRVADNVVAIHTGFADIDALTELACIKILVSLCNAFTLMISVCILLRTRRKPDSNCHQNNEASQSHGATFTC
jgi:hypothetical protein